MAKRFYKYKILFDENMPSRSYFPRLNKYFNVKHVGHDLNKGGASDEDVYALAVSQKRVILTHNLKHFLPLAGTKEDAGIISIPPHWAPKYLDSKLTAFFMKQSPKDLVGKLIPLNE